MADISEAVARAVQRSAATKGIALVFKVATKISTFFNGLKDMLSLVQNRAILQNIQKRSVRVPSRVGYIRGNIDVPIGRVPLSSRLLLTTSMLGQRGRDAWPR